MLIIVLSQIKNLRARGMQFINVPDSYYDNLKAKLAKSKVIIKEDLEVVSILFHCTYAQFAKVHTS